MKRKIVWLVLSGLMVLSLVLASCAPAVTEEEEEEITPPAEEGEVTPPAEEEEAKLPTTTGEPEYGGTAHMFRLLTSGYEPAAYLNTAFSYISYETLAVEDWSRGPSGTGEYPLASTYTPMEGHTGALAESWEQPDLQTLIFYIRKGVHFWDKPPVNGREMNAHDVVYSFDRAQAHPRSDLYVPEDTPEEDRYHARALDDWTVEFTLPKPDVFVLDHFASDFTVFPYEVVDEFGDFEDWRNANGTGPFMLDDVVMGSSVHYSRNPNYWQFDPLHPENRLPYLDEVSYIIIPDMATQLSALRTGKIDHMQVNPEDVGRLKETNPELFYKKLYPTTTRTLYWRLDLEPWSDIRVRYAMWLAVDHQEMKDVFYEGDAEILTWPLMASAGDAYTPLEELPTESRELYEYHPDKAKQLLVEAGYPDGFTFNFIYSDAPGLGDMLALVKSYWEKIGIVAELEPMEAARHNSLAVTQSYPGMAMSGWGNAVPMMAFEYAYRSVPSVHSWNCSNVQDPYIDEQWAIVKGTLDATERNRLWKELNLYAIEKAYYFYVPKQVAYIFWQPWLKGYSGELEVGRLWNWNGFLTYAWLDLDLRESMTGVR